MGETNLSEKDHQKEAPNAKVLGKQGKHGQESPDHGEQTTAKATKTFQEKRTGFFSDDG